MTFFTSNTVKHSGMMSCYALASSYLQITKGFNSTMKNLHLCLDELRWYLSLKIKMFSLLSLYVYYFYRNLVSDPPYCPSISLCHILSNYGFPQKKKNLLESLKKLEYLQTK